MEKVLIKDAHIVNEGTIMRGDVYIEHGIILEISQNLSSTIFCTIPGITSKGGVSPSVTGMR